MRPDPLEFELQDYLDGRLSGAARAAFEARMRADAELARRVGLDREAREALRVELDGDRPSPGFYTRARARFEESRRRIWFRPFSLETAGLTAAVVIAAVVFVPRMAELGLPSAEMAPAGVREGAGREPALVRLEETAIAEEPGPFEPEPLSDKIVAEEKKATAETADHDFAPAPAAGGAGSKSEPTPTQAAPATEPAVSDEASYRRRDVTEPGRSAVSKQSAATAPVDAETARPRLESGLELAGSAQASLASIAFGLPRGAVDPGSVATLRTPEEWAWLSRLGAREASPFRGGRRLVLVGTRDDPFSCVNLTVETRSDRHAIRLFAPAEPDAAARWGCGVDLPDDGRPVRVVGPHRDE